MDFILFLCIFYIYFVGQYQNVELGVHGRSIFVVTGCSMKFLTILIILFDVLFSFTKNMFYISLSWVVQHFV